MNAIVLDETDQLPTLVDTALETSLAIGMSRVEIDQQIATARRYPRQISVVAKNILSTVTLDEETAAECMYALPRGGKPIQGPSIRFAEAVKAFYGNNRSASRVVHVDRAEKVVVAEGIFHDLETNTATRSEVRRRIVDSKGRLYSDDMIIVTGNAAGSIALRNSILGGVPKAVWRRAYEEVLRTIAGDVTTLSVTREKAVTAFANFGATPDQVFAAIGVAGIEDVKLEHIPVLRGMFSALKNAEATVEEMFAPPASRTAVTTGMKARLENRASEKTPASGFDAEHVARETGQAQTAAEAAAEILGDDKVPDFDQATGETSDDSFPGDKPAPDQGQTQAQEQAPADPPRQETTEQPKLTIPERVAAFRKRMAEATNSIKLKSIRRAADNLFDDMERSDPEGRVELAFEYEERLGILEEEERAERSKGGA